MTSELRVAHVVCTDAFAGVERYVTTLASGLAAEGCGVVVIGGNGPRMEPALTRAGVDWRPGATVYGALRRLLRMGDIDLVHAHMTAAETAAVLAAVKLRVPVVATRHFAQTRGSTIGARMVGRILTRRLAGQLSISRFVADSIEGESVVVAPGVPDHPEEPDPAARRNTVLVTQRLEPEKRTDQALHAWKLSGLGSSGWRLLIAGDGQERAALESLASSLGVADSVDFLGAREDIDTLQSTASIQLATRPDEPFGLAVVEAMAAALPVVATASGGHLETVAGVEGASLYPPDDLAKAARLLADLAADPDRRRSYGEALRRAHHERFTVARQVGATLEVYRYLTAST